MSSAMSHLGLLNIVVCSVERLCEGELCCLEHRQKVSAFCLLHKIYHRMVYPMNENLHHFVAARNTRASATLRELALVIIHCRTDLLSQSFLPAAAHLWKLLPSGVFSGGALSSFKSTMNMCIARVYAYFFPLFLSFCCSIACLVLRL